MKARSLLFLAVFCVSVAAAGLASDSNVGTWKLNEAKSTISAGAPKNNTVVYTVAGDSFKCVVDGVDPTGKPAHNEWTGKFDGKDYAIVGDPSSDTRAIQKVDDHHYDLTTKKGGKTTITGTIVLSPDGKMRTLTMHATDAQGKTVTSTLVYDKQ
jgi:hypothetical protein